ncbi:MAG: hypothetical protein RL757_376 [Bacteroidota bacterium]|jgi:hypothetical protein
MSLFYNHRFSAFGLARVRMLFGFAFLFFQLQQTRAQDVFNLTAALNGTTGNSCYADFYDGGGASGSYTNNEDRTFTICGWGVIQLDFTVFDLESGYDFLQVFDGTNTSAPAIHIGSGFTGLNSVNRIIATGNCLTIRFTSNASNVGAGWAARLSCNGNQDCACRRQLLTNNGFESGTTGWTTGIVGSAGTAPVTVYTGGPTGNYLGLDHTDVTNATGDFYVEQYFNNIISDQVYLFSIDAARHAPPGSPRVRLEFYSAANVLLYSTGDYITNTQYPVFTRFSFYLLAPNGATKLRVLGLTNGTALKLDNAKLTTCYKPLVYPGSPNPSTVCSGGTASLTSILTDPTLSATYQWQSSPDANAWTNVSGATASTYTTPALTTSTHYRLLATASGGVCTAVPSSAALVTVRAAAVITAAASSPSFCGSGAVTMSATTTGGVTPCVIQWQSSPNGTTWTNIAGATNLAYTSPTLTATTYFRALFTCAGGCAAATSASSTVTVRPIPNRPCSITY